MSVPLPLHLAIVGHHSVGKTTYLRRLWERYGSSSPTASSPKREVVLEAADDNNETRAYLDELNRRWSASQWQPTQDISPPLRLRLHLPPHQQVDIQTRDVPGEWLELSQAQISDNDRRIQVLREIGRSDGLLLFLEPADFLRTPVLESIRQRLGNLRIQASDESRSRQQRREYLMQSPMLDDQAAPVGTNHWPHLLASLRELMVKQPDPDRWLAGHIDEMLWDRQVLDWLQDITPLNWEGIALTMAGQRDGWPQAPLQTPAGWVGGLFAPLRVQLLSGVAEDEIVRQFKNLLDLWSHRHIGAALQQVFTQIRDHSERLVVALVVLKADQLPGFGGRGTPYVQYFPTHLDHLKLKADPQGLARLLEAVEDHYQGDSVWQEILRDFSDTLWGPLLNLHTTTLDYQAFFVSSLGIQTETEPVGLAQPWVWCVQRVLRLRRLTRLHQWQQRLTWAAVVSWGAFGLTWLITAL